MPSTTPNYGWSYPISSDDLNAGATSIGNLATGADATVKTIADNLATETANRVTGDNNLTSFINGKITQEDPGLTTAAVHFGYANITTDGNGDIYPTGGPNLIIVMPTEESIGGAVMAMRSVNSGRIKFWYTGPVGTGKLTNTTLQINWVRWTT